MKIVRFRKKDLHEKRFAIAEDDGKIVDDAQGYGYKTKEKAVKAMWWKFKGGQAKSNEKVEWWRGHVDILEGIRDFIETYAKEIMIGDMTDDEIDGYCLSIAEKRGVDLPKDMLKFARSKNGSGMLDDMMVEEMRKKRK